MQKPRTRTHGGWTKLRVVVELPVLASQGNTEKDLAQVVGQMIRSSFVTGRQIDGPVGKCRVVEHGRFVAAQRRTNPAHAQFKAVHQMIVDLAKRVSRLEHDTSPHRLAGYGD